MRPILHGIVFLSLPLPTGCGPREISLETTAAVSRCNTGSSPEIGMGYGSKKGAVS